MTTAALSTDLPAVARAIARGEATSAALVEACLARYDALEPRVRAFAWIDPARARRLAAEADRRRAAGAGAVPPLLGIPVGIKDILDTAGVPTEHGSALFAGRVPERSAAAVQALERAGAIVLGKTVTAECAYFHPGPTRNPWNVERTSGGSSMGSAAAVAAGMVPGAVGTQTNGSVIRPAAFCGVVGFKPTAGRLPGEGALVFSQTLDQLGVFARSVEGAAWLAAAIAGEDLSEWWQPDGGAGAPGAPPRLAVARTAEWAHAHPAMQRQFEADVAALAAAGAEVVEVPLPAGMDEVPPLHRAIMAAESARTLGPAVFARPELASATLRSFLEEGTTVSEDAYQEAMRARRETTGRFAAWAQRFDAILTPPAVGEAPGPESTGDPRFCTRWTFTGAPAISLPTGLGPAGLPLGLQLVGAPGADRRLLAAAAWAGRQRPAPALPD